MTARHSGSTDGGQGRRVQFFSLSAPPAEKEKKGSAPDTPEMCPPDSPNPPPSRAGQSHLARLLPFSPLSFPRKRESSAPKPVTRPWIPACAGMTATERSENPNAIALPFRGPLPEMLVGKSMPGAGLEVAFEFRGFCLVQECHVGY